MQVDIFTVYSSRIFNYFLFFYFVTFCIDTSVSSSNSDNDKNYFDFEPAVDAGLKQLNGYFQQVVGLCRLQMLRAYPVVKALSVMVDTLLPASATCERLFSVAGQIFMPTVTETEQKLPYSLILNF